LAFARAARALPAAPLKGGARELNASRPIVVT